MNPEVHYRLYISSPLAPIFSKIYPISSITTHLPQIHFNIILPPVVIILATGSEVRGFKPGRGIFSERKNPEYDFLRKESKAMGPVS